MNRFKLIVPLFLATIGIAPTTTNAYELVTVTETVVVNEVKTDIVRTADNFIVLFDSSSSMNDGYKETGKKKIEVEKAILKARNARLPDLSWKAGLYSYTPGALANSSKVLKTYYDMKPYNKAEFDKAIDQLPTEGSGPTLAQEGLTELGDILSGLSGRTVVFVVTDGKFSEMSSRDLPVNIAKDMASKHDVCFYAISTAPKKQETALLRAVTSVNNCSRMITFDQFVENPMMLSGTLFIVDTRIVPKSTDIEKVIGAKLSHQLFAHNKADINPEYVGSLDKVGKYMQENPKSSLVLFGYTDNNGSDEHNLGLSRRRVESIAEYLVKKYSIESERIVLNWYGEANPVASNDTSEGRALNRRVEGFVFNNE